MQLIIFFHRYVNLVPLSRGPGRDPARLFNCANMLRSGFAADVQTVSNFPQEDFASHKTADGVAMIASVSRNR